jgi:hypothetical protein
VLEGLRRRLSGDATAIDRDRIRAGHAHLDVIAIAGAPARLPVRLAGEIQGLQIVPHGGIPSLEITITDGTGKAAAVFTGRRRIGGIDLGRRILVAGVGRIDHGRLVIVNPAYTLLGPTPQA